MSKSSKIRNKLLINICLIVLVPMILIGVEISLKLAGMWEKEILAESENKVDFISEIVNGIVVNLETSINLLTQNEAIQNSNFTNKKEIFDQLETFTKNNNNIIETFIGTTDGDFVIYPEQKIPEKYDPRERPWYSTSITNPNEIQWTPVYQNKSENKQLVVTIAKPFKDESGAIKGVIGVNLSVKELASRINNIKIGENGYPVLMDQSGNVITYPPDSKMIGTSFLDRPVTKQLYKPKINNKGTLEYVNEDQEKIMTYKINEVNGWRITGTLYKDEVNKVVAPFITQLIIISVIALIIALVIANLIAKNISVRVMQLEKSMKLAESGDLTTKIEGIKGKDELTSVAHTFNQMLEGIREMVSNINITTEQLSASSEQLFTTSEQSNMLGAQISSAIEGITVGSQEQNSKILDMVNVIEEFSNNITKINERVQLSTNNAILTSENAQKGRIYLTEANSTTNEVETIVLDTVTSVEILDKKAKEIDNIIDLISQIAGQTNLLALNAAIEAARAGESGRGFAVVADEVRKLAEESSEAASQIAARIADIQKVSTEVVTKVEKGMESVKANFGIFKDTNSILNEIIINISEITKDIEDISKGTKELTFGSNLILTNIENLSTLANVFSANTQEVNAAVEETTASMEEIKNSATYLAEMGTTLNDSVGRFKI